MFLLSFLNHIWIANASTERTKESLNQLSQIESKVRYLVIQNDETEVLNSEILNDVLNLFENMYENYVHNQSSNFVKLCNSYFISSKSSLNFFESFLDLVFDLYDEKTTKSVDILNTIGLIYFEQNDLAKSEKYFKRSIMLEGLADLKKAPIFNKLGKIQDITGDYKGALINHKKAYEIYINFKLEHEFAFLNILNSLGIVSTNLKQYQEALKYYNIALKWKFEMGQADHIDTASILNNIAYIHLNLKEYEASLELFQKVLEITKKHAKPMDQAFLSIFFNLGNVHYEMGNKMQAQEYFERTLEIIDNNFDESDYLFWADTLTKLGLILSEMGDLKGAFKHSKKALSILDSNLGAGHFISWFALGNMGKIYADLDVHEKALEMYGKQWEIYRKNYEIEGSPPDINPCDALYGLGLVTLRMGQRSEAIEYFEKCLKIKEQFDVQLNNEDLKIFESLGRLCEAHGEYEKAKHFKNLKNINNIKNEL